MLKYLDHERSEAIPDRPIVVTSGGRPRPALTRPLDRFVVHYIGAGVHWLDAGDTAQEIYSIEVNHARPSGKPDEYNSASDSAGETWEWAGPFMAAHNGGGSWGNAHAWGHIVILGVEIPTDEQMDRIIDGILKARRQLVAAGYLTPGHQIAPHGPVSSTSSTCPGVLMAPANWARIAGPYDVPKPPPPIEEETTMTPEQFARHIELQEQILAETIGVRDRLTNVNARLNQLNLRVMNTNIKLGAEIGPDIDAIRDEVAGPDGN